MQWDGQPRTTTFDSATQLRAVIPGTDVDTAGTAQVTVVNPSGGTSNSVTFTITNPKPQIASLEPTFLFIQSGGATITIHGANFLSTSVARWNGQPRSTQFVNATTLKMTLVAGDLSNPGNIPVTVVNPGPGGGTSNAVIFTVHAIPE